MKKCKNCNRQKKDVKLRYNKYKEAIIFDYTKKIKENLCLFCYEALQDDI